MAGAPLTSTYQGAGGSRTFITDDIFMISPEDTPILSRLKSKPAQNTLVQWQTDSLLTPATAGTAEGASIAFSSGVARSAASNYTMIHVVAISVSHTQEDRATRGNIGGLRSEVQYETTKKLKELARNMEVAAIRSTSASGASGTARALDGLQARITTVNNTSASSRAYTRALHNTVVQSIITGGGEPNLLVAKPGVVAAIADFASAVGGGNVYYTQPAADGVLRDMFRTIVDPFGTRQVVLHKYGFATASATATADASASMFLLQTNQMCKWVLRDVTVHKAAKTGLSHDSFAEVEWTLQEGLESAHGQVRNLNN